MRDGFYFCGVDVESIGLEYAPENKDTYVYAPAEMETHEETFEGHDGGYSYGAYRQPKTFKLRCFYEQKHVAEGLMAKVHSLFKVGKKGTLVFKSRPWCYYYVTVTENPDISDMYNYLNGVVVITMKAYYPFARGLEINGHLFYNTTSDPYHDQVMQNTALPSSSTMVPAMSFNSVSNGRTILLLNPGTERAKVDIVMAGTAGNGVTLYNRTTAQSCKYVAFNTSGTDDVYTDGINGKTVLRSGGTHTLAFLYHDHGFIELEPAFPIVRDLQVSYEDSTVTTEATLYQSDEEKKWYEGKYIFLRSAWRKIVQCTDAHTMTLTENLNATGTSKTSIVLLNEVVVTLGQGASLSKLSFVYKPTYA